VRRGEPAPPDDGPSDALTARLPEVVTRVQVARRRGRRHALVGGVAGVVVLALAVAAATVRPWDHGAPDPAPTTTAYAGACDQTLPTGPSLLPVTLADDESTDRTILADQTWHADWAGDTSALTPDQRTLLGTFHPEVVLVRDGRVVGLGVSTGDVVTQQADGTMTTDIAWPGLDSTSTDDGFGPYADYGGNGTLSVVAVRFVPCGGGTMPSGDYRAYLYGANESGSAHVLSAAVPVTVLPDVPAGYQPRWLEGSALACGETVDELVTRIAGHPFIDLDQGLTSVYDDGITYRFTNDAETAQTVFLPRRVAVAWLQDGKVVGVGRDERATGPTTVKAGAALTLSARPWDTRDYCTPSTDGKAPRLKPGTYQTLGYARVPSQDPDDPDAWFLERSGVADVVVHADGSVTYP
jgi:hypothetical protein